MATIIEVLSDIPGRRAALGSVALDFLAQLRLGVHEQFDGAFADQSGVVEEIDQREHVARHRPDEAGSRHGPADGDQADNAGGPVERPVSEGANRGVCGAEHRTGPRRYFPWGRVVEWHLRDRGGAHRLTGEDADAVEKGVGRLDEVSLLGIRTFGPFCHGERG
jgi:hypothetical protein